MTKSLRLTIDIEIDEARMENAGKDLLDIAADLRLYDHDALDGFDLVRQTDDLVENDDFLLKDASLLAVHEVTDTGLNKL